jgi:hypothetical protein
MLCSSCDAVLDWERNCIGGNHRDAIPRSYNRVRGQHSLFEDEYEGVFVSPSEPRLEIRVKLGGYEAWRLIQEVQLLLLSSSRPN